MIILNLDSKVFFNNILIFWHVRLKMFYEMFQHQLDELQC